MLEALIKAFREIAPHLKHPLVLVGFALLLFFGVHGALIDSGIIPPLKQDDARVVVYAILDYGFLIAIVTIGLGFGLAFFKHHRASVQPVDVDRIVGRLIDNHEGELAACREREACYRSLIDSLQETIRAIPKQTAIRDAKARIEFALRSLEVGRLGAAEAIFTEVLDEKSAEGTAANREAAEAARHLGTLYFLHDTDKALTAYRRATELDADSGEGWSWLGHLLFRIGDMDGAERAYRQLERLGREQGSDEPIAVAYGNLGKNNRGRTTVFLPTLPAMESEAKAGSPR